MYAYGVKGASGVILRLRVAYGYHRYASPLISLGGLDCVLIKTTLIATNDLQREAVAFTIPERDWALLKEFWQRAEVLRSTRFVQEQRGGSISIKLSLGQPVRLGSERLDEEPIWAMLLKLRPFVLQNERCHHERMRSSSASETFKVSIMSEKRSFQVWRRTCGVIASNSPLKAFRSSAKIAFTALSDRGAPVPMAMNRNG
ncbi:protein of unknown function [Pseudomonas mediterranea]